MLKIPMNDVAKPSLVRSFEENNRRFLKSTISEWKGTEPALHYEDVDTSVIAPRPRLYGLVGAEAIEEVWKNVREKRPAQSAAEKNLTPSPRHMTSRNTSAAAQ